MIFMNLQNYAKKANFMHELCNFESIARNRVNVKFQKP